MEHRVFEQSQSDDRLEGDILMRLTSGTATNDPGQTIRVVGSYVK